ncbi:branched-chain amino acid ABC transporter permease [Zhengella mangrovi]|uniref:Branched-chain amino acid ABC transporter permease n=1 Tax=Zhengella mangrovi TaxID=1982044 RepID=A0A2G1QME4_9HYPH|nr:branched-chain amino acid ABC transporter permease [Zhengella mangrovi]PHP66398.1 branched-chain amino acid ABC transporter permease [Zhengella mangrovi]
MRAETLFNLVLVGGLLAVALIAFGLEETFTITLVTKVAIFAIAGIGLNLALGQGGLVSFGHAAFFGLGGYAVGILSSHAQNYEPLMEWPFLVEGTTFMPVLWLVAVLVSGIAALAIGAISLRTAGVYFIMITLAFAQMIYYFAISWPAYGGEDGLSIYVRNGFPGLNTLDPLSFFLLVFAVLLLVVFLAARLQASRFGMTLEAARQNALRVTSAGISPYRVRLVAFVISAMITGLAGALYADLNRFVSPAMLSWQTSGEIMVFVILGGVGRLAGPIAGAALFVMLEHFLGGLAEHWQFFLGLALLGVVLFARGGLAGFVLKERGRG